MTASAFPLAWPEGFPRSTRREAGKFRTSLSAALKNVSASIRLFGADSGIPVKDIILSSNVTLGAMTPADPGVAVWFLWDGQQRCIPVDRYTSVEANLQAIHHIVEARRVELRHGTIALVRATFKGFTLALPAPAARSWREVLGLNIGGKRITREMVETSYRALAKERHPDAAGGSGEAMAEVNAARDAALKEIENG